MGIGAILEFFHARKWLVELVIVALLVSVALGWYHGRINAAEKRGGDAQLIEDNKAADLLRQKVAALTAQNLVLAHAAEAKYESDHASNIAGASAPVGTSQLCKPAPAYDGSVSMHPTQSADPSHANTAAPAQMGGAVPAADNGQPYDRQRLLGAFAALFDDQDAVVGLFQARDIHEIQPGSTP